MKMHPANDSERPRGPAGLAPRCSFARLVLIFAALFSTGALRAQTFLPVISQILAAEDNASYYDPDGDLPAVIFIKNNGSVAGTISNWSLTDSTAVPRKWIIPTVGAAGGARTLGAGETLIVFASGKNRTTDPLATNFLLPCTSTGYLYNPQGSLVSQKVVSSENCPECIDLLSPNSTSAWIIPTVNDPAATSGDWRLPPFDDSKWRRGQPCLGYESDPLLQNMILYSTFDTPDVDTVNRTITDVSGALVFHTGTWPLIAGGAPAIGIPLATLPKVLQNVGFTGPQNPSSYVVYNHHAELNPGTQSYTFSIWVRPTNRDLSAAGEVIFRKGFDSTTSSDGYLLRRNNDNTVSFLATVSGIGSFSVSTPFQANGGVTFDTWTHLSVVILRGSTNSVTIYQNGDQLVEKLIDPKDLPIRSSDSPLHLARQVAGGGPIMFTGRMDDFVTWGRALSKDDVNRVYQAGNAGRRVDDPGAPGAPQPIYTPWIQTNTQNAMKGVNTSLYERIPFTVASPSLVRSMTFKVRYDDGFIAYINGVEIARRNAPTGVPAWNSAAASDRVDTNALTAEEIPVPSAALAALTTGTNMLAIHALNFTASDQRFLICPQLCYDELTPEDCYFTTNGKLFWITFPGNAPEEIANPLQLSVCITGAAGTTGNVSMPGITPPFSQNFTLPASGKIELSLPKAASLEKSDLIENRGVRIAAAQNVAVVGKTRIDFSTDTFLAHPIRVLGSSYLTLGWGNSWNGLPDLNGSQFGIVATADNTHVTITPKVTTGSHPAGVPYNFILNAGQTYMLRNTSDSPADLTGSRITSDSPVAVFGGHRCANISGSLFFCDTVLEQTLPVSLWAREYAMAPLATRTAAELVRVIAAENSTSISINGVLQAGVLNAGDKKEYSVAGGAVFTSTKNFLATHLSRSSDADGVVNSDPFQLNCQPTSSWLAGYRFCTPPAGEFSGAYVNLLARSAEIAGVSVNPAPVADSGPIAIAATGYSYRRLTLAPGTTYTTSGRTHGLEAYGWGQYDSYGHSGGMGFNDTQPPSFTQCPPDITLFTTSVPGAGTVASLPDFGAQFGIKDNCCPDRSISIVQTPGPGTLLQVGDYQVVISATDCNKNTVTCVVNVHVRTDPRAAAFPNAFGVPALEATVWGWNANPDGDCLNNEQEYALGTNMAVLSGFGNAFSFREAVRNGVNGVEASFRFRNDDPSLEYILEGSSNLSGWQYGLGHFVELSSEPDPLAGFTRVTAWSVDSENYDRFFLRLRTRRN